MCSNTYTTVCTSHANVIRRCEKMGFIIRVFCRGFSSCHQPVDCGLDRPGIYTLQTSLIEEICMPPGGSTSRPASQEQIMCRDGKQETGICLARLAVAVCCSQIVDMSVCLSACLPVCLSVLWLATVAFLAHIVLRNNRPFE